MESIWNSIMGYFTKDEPQEEDEEAESSEGSCEYELSDDRILQHPAATASHENDDHESSKDKKTENLLDKDITVPMLKHQSFSELNVVHDLSKKVVGLDKKEPNYRSVLHDLKLNAEIKLTLKNARIVDNNTFNDKPLTYSDQIPRYIVEKLMIVDYRARAFKLSQANKEDNCDDSDDDEKYEEIKESVNPMDAFLAVFHTSDDFLRQELAIKLSACQLSVPFLLPDPIQPSQKITILMWALKGIKKSWKAASNNSEKTRARHVFVLEHPFPIVSFIRIGTTAFSKSVLLNKLMSDVNGYHDFFFHKDCKGGGVERRIVDGLVELCWYLPGERKCQAFPQEMCFANLRGDARNFKKQLRVLTKISSVMFLLISSECPEESKNEVLKEAAKSEAKVFLVFEEKPLKDSKQYFDDLKQKHQGKLFCIYRVTHANEDDFIEMIRRKIQRNTCTSTAVPLKMISSLAKECQVTLDEESDTNHYWREEIGRWIEMGPKKIKMLLKLQTQIATLANLEREQYCWKPQGDRSENERIDDIYMKIEAAKRSQKESFGNVDEHMWRCLNRISTMNNVERDYSLTILKHDLDKMSLEVLGSLQAEYRDAWLDIQRKKKQHKLDGSDFSLSQEEQRLKQLEKSILESSIGLEHIIREIAQMFQLVEIDFFNYAGVAADILLSGQPLELMDGDSSYIPLKWLNAVFVSLARKTNDAKIFVISVLGIQSSGKSTMLNTMFGLEFPVSAGRCTRGAFASLIPISDSLKTASKFDYILIIDTEGLRGSGDPEVRQHDNELATFAIGVADLTVVNIFGENYNEMKEFLEIAVHAFLKMKLVKEKRMCQIVHQNVAAIEASDNLTSERITLKKKLDDMAKLAAIQENCDHEFQELNDILSFDENEDVFYIPSLLQGSPPMAPVNPDYGRAVQNVREKIISLMCLPERSHLCVSQFRKRVCDLWKAILRENFIFSFRNTIEVRAYTSLDQKYFEESMKTMVTGMTELEKRIQVSLMRSSADAREGIWSVSKVEIRERAEQLGKKMTKAMEVFFETNEDKATLEQWKETVMNKISYLKDSQHAEVLKNCQAAFNYWQSRQEVDEKKQTCETMLLAKARKFITSIEDTDGEEKCKAKFKQEWQQWLEDVPPCRETKLDVNREMILVLLYTGRHLAGEMKRKFRSPNYMILDFKNTCPSIQSQLNLGAFERFMGMFRSNPQLVVDAERIRDQAVNAAADFAQNTSRSGARCRPDDLKRMYHLVISTIQNETKKQRFKFPDSLLCDTLLYSFANTYHVFCEMEERYMRERDIRGDLERSLRPKLEKYFLNMCKDMKNEVLAATSMLDVLQKAIELEFNKSMGPAVAGEILKKPEFQSKGQFHASVLIKLGEKGKFDAYCSYLQNPVKHLRTVLKTSMKDFCLTNEDNSINLLTQNEISKIEMQVFTAISTASNQVKSTNATFTKWIEKFVENCSTLEITTEMFAVAAIDDDLKDFETFESQVIQYVKDFLELLFERGVNNEIYNAWRPAPHEKLLDLMFGCQECCPFCNGLCDQTVRDHAGGHSTRIHRPQGITGYRNINTQILETRICTTLVASDWRFKNSATSDNWHPYKDYQTVNEYYKSWSIPPDPSFEASTYWKWFIATFARELANFYNAKQPDVPLAWKSISFKEASKQLREEYNLA